MLARSVTLNFVGTAVSLAIGFAASIMLARWLGPADRGLLALMVSVSAVALTVTGMGLPMAVLYYASLPQRSARSILGTTLAVAALLTAVLLPLAWLLHGTIADTFARGRGGLVWVLAALLVPVTFLDWTTHNQVLGQRRFGLYNVMGILSKLATLALVVALVGVLGLGVTGGLIATAAASLVMIAGSLPPILADGRPRVDRRLLRTMTAYGARVQVGTIFTALNFRFDTLLLQFFRPLAAVGYYVVAQVIAELVITLATAFQSSVIPLVAGSEGEDRRRTTVLSIRHHGILAALATVANAGFGSLVILFAYGPAFHAALVPMLILLPGMWFLGTGTIVGGDLRGRGRPGLASTVAGVGMAVTVGLDFALIPPLGVTGAAIASLVGYVVFGVVSLATLARTAEVPLRELVVPTRADLAAYAAALRRLRERRAAAPPLTEGVEPG